MRVRTHTAFRPGSEGGFTLIEAVIAIVVVSVGMLGLAAMLPMMKSDLGESHERTRATFLADRSVEWLHGLPYDDPQLTPGTHPDPDFAVPGFTRSWTVETGVPVANVKRVTVVVTPENPEAGQEAQQVFLHARAGR